MFGKVLTGDGIMYKFAVTCCERFSDPIILRRRAIHGHTLHADFGRLGAKVCTVCGAATSIHQWQAMYGR